MRKKILLFSVGVVLAVGGFSAYWALTGATFVMHPPRTRPSATTSDQPDVYEVRDEKTGQLQYVLIAKHANMVQPGRYLLDHPSATYYLRDNQLAVLTADSGTMNIEQVGGIKAKPVPKGGTLSGHVTLTIGTAESFATGNTALQPGQVQATLEQDLDFDYARREISSPGRIHVISDRPAERGTFDGAGFTLIFNRDQKRIEYLRITHGEKIVVKQWDKAVGSRAGQESPAPTAPSGTQTALTATPATPTTTATTAEGPTTYRLVLNDNVKAQWDTGELASDLMNLIFQSQPGKESSSQPAQAASQRNAATEETPLALGGTTAPATTGAAKNEDMVITWTGPLEVRPMPAAEAKLVNPKDMIFEAASLPGHIVTLKDGTATASIGKLHYQSGLQRIQLDAGPSGTIELADSKAGTMVATGMLWLRTQGRMVFGGPGRATMLDTALQEGAAPAPRKAPVTSAWTKSLDLTLVPDARKTAKKAGMASGQVIREAILTGDADVRDPASFWIHGDSIDALIAQTAEGRQALEHLLALGSVQAVGFRNASSGAAADAEPDGLRATRLEVKTTPGAAGKGPQPDVVLADGDVVAVSHQLDKKDPTKVQRQQIATPKLIAYLEPKPSSTTTPAATAPAQGLGGFAVKRLLASQGVQVKMDGYGPEPVEASADTLSADTKAGTAVLQGVAKAGTTQFVRVRQGERQIAGMTVLLDREAQSLEVPGPGDILFEEAPKKPTDKPLPVQIRWVTSMRYSGRDHEAVFIGSAKAMVIGRADQESELSADRIRAVLAGAGATTRPAAAGDAVAMDSGKLSELHADGNVDASGATYDPAHKLLTRMHLMNVDSLNYDKVKDLLTIPGKGEMYVEDYRPESPAKQDNRSARGKTAFSWEQGLTYAGQPGEIELHKNVKMVHQPTKPLTMPSVAGGGDAAGGGGKAQGIKTIFLTCADLKAWLAKNETAAAGTTNSLALGTNSQASLSRVLATGSAQLTLDENVLRAQTLEMDTARNKAVAIGQGENYAQLLRPGVAVAEARRIEWDLTKEGGFVLENPRANVVVPAGTGGTP